VRLVSFAGQGQRQWPKRGLISAHGGKRGPATGFGWTRFMRSSIRSGQSLPCRNGRLAYGRAFAAPGGQRKQGQAAARQTCASRLAAPLGV